jgi:hypothetical protein
MADLSRYPRNTTLIPNLAFTERLQHVSSQVIISYIEDEQIYLESIKKKRSSLIVRGRPFFGKRRREDIN